MRHVLCGLLVSGMIACAATSATARCGDQPGDTDAVSSVVGAIVTECGCCRATPPVLRSAACALRTVVDAVDAGALPRRCAHVALRRASFVCRRRRQTVPCLETTTTTTLPPPPCSSDADCDDGNACSADACVNGRCTHRCMCFGPGGGPTCCPGPAATCARLRYYRTCGEPVCRSDGSTILPGVPPCTTQQEGAACTTPGATCDPGLGCGVRLVCASHGPDLRRCPISERRAKRDITYLSRADAERLHDDVMRLRLATYQYRAEGAAGPRRLGFVIDDVGEIPAVAPGRDMVDLYGYASMMVAAIQTQGREIDRLHHEVDALRRECRAPAP